MNTRPPYPRRHLFVYHIFHSFTFHLLYHVNSKFAYHVAMHLICLLPSFYLLPLTVAHCDCFPSHRFTCCRAPSHAHDDHRGDGQHGQARSHSSSSASSRSLSRASTLCSCLQLGHRMSRTLMLPWSAC
jgi:hypothetical protein